MMWGNENDDVKMHHRSWNIDDLTTETIVCSIGCWLILAEFRKDDTSLRQHYVALHSWNILEPYYCNGPWLILDAEAPDNECS